MELDFFKKSPVIHNTLFSDSFIFTGGDLFGGVSFEESVNAGEDLTPGSCVMSSIEFQLKNLNMLINSLTGTELTWKQSVKTGETEYQSFARASRGNPVCLNGSIAYVCQSREPYLSIWRVDSNSKLADADSQPTKPVKGLALVEGKLYCLHDEEPWLTAYQVSGQKLTPAASPAVSSFFQNKIKYLCRWKYAVNVQGNVLREYAVKLEDLRPDNLIESAYEYIQMGVFIAEKPEKVNDTRIRVKCYDRLSLLDRYVDGWLDGLTYPLTLKAMLRSLCSYAGVPYNDSTFPNQSYSIQRNFAGENVSGLQVLRWIAEIAARFGRMDEQGRFTLDWYRAVPFTVDSSVFTSVEVEDYVTAKIEKLQAKSTDNDIGVLVPPNAPESSNTLVLSSNPLLYAESDAELRPVVENIYNAVKDISYQPYSVSMRWEVPLLRAGNVFTLKTRKEQTFPAYLMSRSLKSSADSYEATGSERREIQSNQVNQSIQRLRGKTNEIISTIEEFSVTLTDVETQTEENTQKIVTNSAQILAQADQISLEVKRATEAEGELSSRISTQANQIELKVSKTDYNGNTIASLINQTATSILIQADKINLKGYVTADDLETGDLTVNGTFVSENGSERIVVEDGFITFYYGGVAKGRIYTNANTGEGIVLEAGTNESGQGPLTFAAGGYLRGQIRTDGVFDNQQYGIKTTGQISAGSLAVSGTTQAGVFNATGGYRTGNVAGLSGNISVGGRTLSIHGGIVTGYS